MAAHPSLPLTLPHTLHTHLTPHLLKPISPVDKEDPDEGDTTGETVLFLEAGERAP